MKKKGELQEKQQKVSDRVTCINDRWGKKNLDRILDKKGGERKRKERNELNVWHLHLLLNKWNKLKTKTIEEVHLDEKNTILKTKRSK